MNFPEATENIANYARNFSGDVHQLLLGKQQFSTVSNKKLVQQILGYQIAATKFPSLYNQELKFPPTLNLQQSSSELTANYKSSLIISGNRMIDCTGGFGIDTMAFAKHFKEVIYCERNKELCEIAAFNFSQLNLPIQVIHGDGIELITKSDQPYDLIYIDPSRRIQTSKVFKIEDSEPNIVNSWSLLLQAAKTVLVKLSPMVDVSATLQQLPHIKEIHAVSVKNDVKELLLIAEQNYSGQIKQVAVDFGTDKQVYEKQSISGITLSDNKDLLEANYVYEPFGVAFKINVEDEIASMSKLTKIAKHSHLYFSTEDVSVPLMKQFYIHEILPFQKKVISERVSKANVITRNFYLKPAEVYKKLNLQQGGNDYLICTKTSTDKAICIYATKIV